MIFLIIINEYKANSKNNAFIPYVETGINNKLYAGIKPGKKPYPNPIQRKLYYKMVGRDGEFELTGDIGTFDYRKNFLRRHGRAVTREKL